MCGYFDFFSHGSTGLFSFCLVRLCVCLCMCVPLTHRYFPPVDDNLYTLLCGAMLQTKSGHICRIGTIDIQKAVRKRFLFHFLLPRTSSSFAMSEEVKKLCPCQFAQKSRFLLEHLNHTSAEYDRLEELRILARILQSYVIGIFRVQT